MRKSKALRFEQLENRRLLAADLGYDIMQACDAMPVEECMVAPEIAETATQEVCVDPIAPDQNAGGEGADNASTMTLNLADGMDGYFGTLDSENQSDTLNFTTSSNGMVDIVVASSFGENSTNLQVNDTDGNPVAATATEGLEGFATLSFAAQADQSYELIVSSEDGGEGSFQVTVGVEAIAEETTDEGPAAEEDGEEDCIDDTTSETDADVGEEDADAGLVAEEDGEEGDVDEPNSESGDETDDDVVDAGPVAEEDSEEDCIDDTTSETDEDAGEEDADAGPVSEEDGEDDDVDEPTSETGDETDDDVVDAGPVAEEDSEEDCIDDTTSETDADVDEEGTDAGPVAEEDGEEDDVDEPNSESGDETGDDVVDAGPVAEEDSEEDCIDDTTSETDEDAGEEVVDAGPVSEEDGEEDDVDEPTSETGDETDDDVVDAGPVAEEDSEEDCIDDTTSETDEDVDEEVVDAGPVADESGSEGDPSGTDVEPADGTDEGPIGESEEVSDEGFGEEEEEPVSEGNETESEEELDAGTDAGPEAESGTQDDEADPTDNHDHDHDDTIDCVDDSGDLHVDQIGADATEILIVEGTGSVQGDLETSGDVDVFRFTAPNTGEISLFAGELSEEDVNLDVKIFDSSGELIVDGATNEAVKISFLGEQDSEYFVVVNSDADQTGTYEVLIEVSEPEIVDDHVNEIGDEATMIETVDGVGNASGVLEVGVDTDALRVIAGADGEIVLDLNVESEDHQSDAQVSVYANGQLIADGTTNESVGLRFDVSANAEYQILVDSANDTLMTFDLTTKEYPTSLNSTETIVDAGPISEAQAEEVENDLETEVCTFDDDCSEESAIDEIFSTLGEDEFAAADLGGFGDKPDYTNFGLATSLDVDQLINRLRRV